MLSAVRGWFAHILSCSQQSCELSRWIEHAQTQVVQTCWAAMALMYAQYPDPEPIERAVRLVMSRQNPVSLLLSLCEIKQISVFI